MRTGNLWILLSLTGLSLLLIAGSAIADEGKTVQVKLSSEQIELLDGTDKPLQLVITEAQKKKLSKVEASSMMQPQMTVNPKHVVDDGVLLQANEDSEWVSVAPPERKY